MIRKITYVITSALTIILFNQDLHAQCTPDVTPPTITCPADIVVNNNPGFCGEVVTFADATASDFCGGTTVALIGGLPSGSTFPVGTTVQTFEALDDSGNSSTCSFNITVIDNEPPILTCQSDITVSNAPGACSQVVNFIAPVGVDNCPGVTTIQTAGLPTGSSFPVGSTVQTYESTDASGLVSTCSFNIIVIDNELPQITCPANITIAHAPGTCGRVVTFATPLGTDNCPGASTVQTTGLPSGSTFPVGTTVQTFVVTDGSGNSVSCSFNVVVTDTELPVISCPANIVVNNTPGFCGRPVSYTVPVGTDNCPGVTTGRIAGLASGATFPVGVTTVTYQATDASGNTASCSFTVTVNDTQFPMITCPANIVRTVTPGTCGRIVFFSTPGGSDNCPGFTVTQIAGLPSGSTFPVGITTNTFRVTDASGNSTTCSFTVTVNDNELPTISCPGNITVPNDPGVCGAVVAYAAPAFSDNCPGAVLTQTSGFASGATFPIGTTTNSFLVTDAVGNTATCSFTVTVNDTELPVIICPADITVANDLGICGAVVNFANPVGTDNCPGVTTVQSAGLASGSTFPIGTSSVSFTSTDASGNTASCSFNITVNDTELPVITCPADITVSNDGGSCDAVVTYTAPIGTDNCPGAVTVQTAGLPSGSTFPVGTTVNTFTVTDAAGNFSSCSFNVVVNDTEDPVIACPANITVPNDPGSCDAVVAFAAPIGTDNCPGQVTAQTAGLPSGSAFPVGTTVNTFTVTDAFGNSASCSFNVIVNDTEDPVITCPADITVPNDPGTCGASVAFAAPVGTDNCPGASTAQIGGLASGSTFPIGTTAVTFEVTDAAGNTAQCSFNVTVNDTEDPIIACPADVNVSNDAGSCDAVVTFVAPVGTDNCPGAVTAQIAGLPSGSTFPLGTTTQTFEVTDASGNTAQCSFNVTVNDTEDPVIACPADINVSNDGGACDAVVAFVAPVGTDNCPGEVTVQTAGMPSGSAFPVGTTTNTFTVTDAAGNSASCSFNVVVMDAERPVINCPGDISVSNDPGICGAVVAFIAPVGTDNCPGVVTSQTAGLASGSTFPIGTTLVTFTSVDAAGNVAACSFNITVNDTEPPVITCPADIVVSNDPGMCDAVVNFAPPVGTDNCPGATTVQTAGLSSGATFPLGTSSITFTVTDAAGNSSSCSFNVTVNDTEPPVISCPADITVSNDPGMCDAVVTFVAPVGTDNCPGVSTIQTAGLASGSSFPLGTTVITFTSTDASGNISNCSFNITVNDNEDPIISCPADISVNSDPGVCDAVVAYTTPVGTDNCPGETTVQTAGLPSGSAFPVGTTVNTFTVTDAAGNSASCSFNVTVNEVTPPTITCPADISVNNDPGICGAVVIFADPIVTDNCPGATFALTGGLGSGSTFPVGTTIVTFTATDLAGNTSSCSFNVTVADIEPPVITCPADITVSNDPGTCDAIVNFAPPVGTDNCPGAVTVQIAGLASGSVFPLGTTTNTFEVTDASGNTAQCSFDVTVNDTENPVVNCPADIIVSNDPGSCDAVVTFVAPVGTDNCPGVSTVQTAGPASGSTFPLGTTSITFTSTDAAGNSASCSFDITVNDTEDPVISCPVDITVSNDPGSCDAVVAFVAPVGTDNCPGAVTAQTAGLPSGSAFPTGTTVNTFTVTDAAGNSSSCSFNITVNEITPPVITCPGDISVNNDPGVCGADVTYADPVVTDNCPGATFSLTTGFASGATFPVGTTLVTYTGTDLSGNTATCTFNVTVTDVELPVINCPADLTVSNDLGSCDAIVNFIAPVGTDNCPGSTTVQIAGLASGSVYPLGTTTNTFEVTDASGNSTTCSFNVTVNDTENPIINCPTDISVNTSASTCDAIVNYTAPVGTDNCPGSVTIQTAGLGSGATYPLGVTTETYMVTDAAGNTSTCSFNIDVIDNTLPVLTCQADVVLNNDPTVCGAVYNFVPPAGTDNCVVFGTVQDSGLPSGSVFPVGVTVQSFTVTDASGNSTTCTFNVTVLDVEPPVTPVLADAFVECAPTPPTTTDNCDGTVSGTTSTPIVQGFNVVTWTFTDAAGNFTSANQNVTVNDVTPPVAPVLSDVTGECTATAIPPTALDNCVGSVIGTTVDPLTYSTQGTFVINWTFDDGNGNISNTTQNVVINDITPPTISAPPTVTTLPNNAGCSAIVTLGVPITADNCAVVSVTNDAPGSFPLGTTTVTWTVTDINGNTNTSTQLVEVLPITSTINPVACDVYTAPDGATYTTNGSYTAVIPGSFGCDSTITINLTVNESTFSEIDVVSCASYIAPDGAVYNTNGTYTAVISNAAGCDSTMTINLTIDEAPSTAATVNNNVLSASASGYSYQWINCNGDTPINNATNQVYAPAYSGSFAVIITNGTCVDTSACLPVNFEIIIPEVITPNGDGDNDLFEIIGIFDYPNNKLEIYNRWGNLIYSKEGYQNDWAGINTESIVYGDKELPTGTYFYVLDLGMGKEVKPFKGYVYITK